MRSSLPKVLHPVCGRPMVAWPVLAAREAGAARIAVIVSPDRDLASGLPEGTETVIQPEADGTGGAVRAAHDLVRDSETVVVLSGDHPLITAEIIAALLETHRAIRRRGDGDDGRARRPGRLRPHRPRRRRRHRAHRRDQGPRRGRARDARDRARSTPAPTSSPPSRWSRRSTASTTTTPPASTTSATCCRCCASRACGSSPTSPTDPNVNLGVNHRADLALVTAEARRQILERHMLAGVTIVDPALDLDRRRRRDRRRRDDRARHHPARHDQRSVATRSSAPTRP